MSLTDYLSMSLDDRPTFARVEDEAGAGLVGRPRWLGQADGTKVLILIQDKGYDCRIDFDPKSAVYSVLPEYLFMQNRTTRSPTVPPHLLATRQRVELF